jgi:hypothetical protein
LTGGNIIRKINLWSFPFLLLSLAIILLSVNAICEESIADTVPANITQTDLNGSFTFSDLPAGYYNLTAYRLILGAMHYMGDVQVNLTGNVGGINITVSRSDDAHYALFKNSSIDLTMGNSSLSGFVLGPNRPGAEPAEIPYEETMVKITAFSETTA